jgi:hypothetical protein
MKMPTGWVKLNDSDARAHLRRTYYYSDKCEDGEQSDTRKVLCLIQQYQSVDFVGSFAGHVEGFTDEGGARMLVTSSPKFISPMPGNWDMLRGILERMFGDTQLPYLYGWIKLSLEMFMAQVWMAGQILVLCGEVQSGKNLVGSILQVLFGGRAPGKPYGFMTKATDFNSDFMGCELLTIEDEASTTGIQARRDFGARLKDIAVNASRRLHRKHAEALTVIPFQRLLISLNNEPERLLVLPPMDSDIEDKMMLLMVEKHEMPMPTNTPKAMAAFWAAVDAELPAFVDFLKNWEIPPNLVSNRFGITHYHHPELLDSLYELSPEEKLLQLIDEEVLGLGTLANLNGEWKGRSSELDRILKASSNNAIQREARDLLPATNNCGKYLARLANRYPDRITRYPGSSGIHNWRIRSSRSMEESCETTGRKKFSSELMERILGGTTARGPAFPILSSEDDAA